MQPNITTQNNDTKSLLYVIVGAIIFFLIVMPLLSRSCDRRNREVREKLSNIGKNISKIDTRMCSPQCCKFTQWQLPKEIQPKGPMTEDQLKDVIGSNFSCGWGEGGGCVCLTKDDFNMLSDHAGNGTPSCSA